MSNMEKHKYFYYGIKCRSCGRLNNIYFGDCDKVEKKTFMAFINEHSTFPIHLQCKCDRSIMLLHDIVSYGPLF